MTYSNVLTSSFVTAAGEVTTSGEITLIHEAAPVGPQIPACELHARRIAREAEAWLALATERTRQREATLRLKAFDAACFSVARKATSLAIPSKLSSVADHQRQLWTMVREHAAPWSPLGTYDTGDGIQVFYEDHLLGEIQPKHLGWARPLMPFGLRLYLSRITGVDRERGLLGCNIVFGHVGDAVGRLSDALSGLVPPASHELVSGSHDGDGATGDLPRALFGPPAIRLHAERGDGAPEPADRLRLAVAGGIPVRDEAAALDAGASDDIVLFRRIDNTACTSIPHVVTHSPTGIDWGERAGQAGMADLAISILIHVADEDTADALATRFVDSIIRRLPYRGGVLRASDVRTWITRSAAGGQVR